MADEHDAGHDGPTFRMIYRSHVRIPAQDRKAELGAIFSVARANNKKHGITGALLIADEYFVQALEGDESTVRSLYDTIHGDSRHERVTVVEAETVPERIFSRWSMAQVTEDGEPDIPLLMDRDKGGATPAARRTSTPEQDALLDTMRGHAREDA